MLYSIYSDMQNYMYIGFDWKQIIEQMGDEYRFDIDRTVKRYAKVWTSPVRVDFGNEGMKGTKMPDISEHLGRLFLSERAYDALYSLLKNDGEFLPVEYEKGRGYMFNPLQLAESVDALDKRLSIKNEWGETENIAFDESKVKDFTVFKSEFDEYASLYCQESVKDAVKKAGLGGVIFTPDLGNYFSAHSGLAE